MALLSAPQMSHLENGHVELDDPYSHVCGPSDGRRSEVYAPWGPFLPLLESSLVALMCLQRSLPTRRSQAFERWSLVTIGQRFSPALHFIRRKHGHLLSPHGA